MPIERAVPSTIFIAASMSRADKSTILRSAISFTCALVTLPTLAVFGVAEPFSTLAAFFKSSAAGGVLSLRLMVRSSKMVISTGMMSPIISDVNALNLVTNSWMLTPCGPKAVPTGGAGVALPAGAWILITVLMAGIIISL